jgi:chromosome segregation ATPase
MSDDPTARILSAIEGVRTDLRTDLREEITGLRQEFTQEIAGLRQEITGLRQDVLREITALRQEVLREITDLRQEIASLWQEITKVRTAVMDRIDRLQDQLTARRDADAVNSGAAERAEAMARAAQAGMHATADQIGALVRMVRSLSSRVDALEEKLG